MPKAANRTISGIVTKSLAAAGAIASELRRHLADELERHGEALNPQQVIDLARDVLRQWEPLVAENLTAADLAAMIAGMSFVAAKLPDWSLDLFAIGLPASGPPPKLPPLLGSGGGGSDDPKLRFPIIDNALASLVDRQIVRRPVYDQLEADARARSFTIAGDITEGTIDDVRRVLMADVEAGTSYTGFRQRITEQLGGSPIGEAHLENVYRTNLQASFRDGREMLAAHPVVAEIFPYQEYVPIHDGRVREEHEALAHLGIDGTGVYRREDPFWDYFTPPWGYQCRCGVNLLGIADAARLGVREASEWLETGVKPPLRSRLAEIPFKPTDGFGYRGRTSVAVRMATQGMLFETGKNKTLWEQPKPKPKQPDNPWQPYTGPRGGKGWKHAGTGVIVYQTERPGAEQLSPQHDDPLYRRRSAIRRTQERVNNPQSEADHRRRAIWQALRSEFGDMAGFLAADVAHGPQATQSTILQRFSEYGLTEDKAMPLAAAAAKALREYHTGRGEFATPDETAETPEELAKQRNRKYEEYVRRAEAQRAKRRDDAIAWAHANIDYAGPLHQLNDEQAGALHWMRIERKTRKDAKDFIELKNTIENWRAEPEKADQAAKKAASSHWKSRFGKYRYSWNRDDEKHKPNYYEASEVAQNMWEEANHKLATGRWYSFDGTDPIKAHEEAVEKACLAGLAHEVPLEYLRDHSYKSWIPKEIKAKLDTEDRVKVFRDYRDGPEHAQNLRELQAAQNAAREALAPVLDRAGKLAPMLRDEAAYDALRDERNKLSAKHEENVKALDYLAATITNNKIRTHYLMPRLDEIPPQFLDEWKRRTAEKQAYYSADRVLNQKMRDMKREASQDWLWSVMGDDQATGEGDIAFEQGEFLSDEGRENLSDAAAFLQRLLGKRLGRVDVGMKLSTAEDGRASAGDKTMNLFPSSGATTIVHEVGHVIDHHAGNEISRLSKTYCVKRLAESNVEPKWPGEGYDPWEIMHQDGLRDEYCGKFYPHESSEILSMGCQYLYADAERFFAEDPDHFAFTLAAVRGLLT